MNSCLISYKPELSSYLTVKYWGTVPASVSKRVNRSGEGDDDPAILEPIGERAVPA